jgi:hypothetical protein
MILNEVKFEGAKVLLKACHVSRRICEVETRRVKQVQRSETAHERVTWHEALVRPNGINRICTSHRHAVRMMAQRMAWDNSRMARRCLEGVAP